MLYDERLLCKSQMESQVLEGRVFCCYPDDSKDKEDWHGILPQWNPDGCFKKEDRHVKLVEAALHALKMVPRRKKTVKILC